MSDIYFSLPGLTKNFILNVKLLDLMNEQPEWFLPFVKIKSIYGDFPISLWNCGRVEHRLQYSKELIKDCVDIIHGFGVNVSYTYSNPKLTEEDLTDEHCNYCLSLLDVNDDVHVVNPILENYIRNNYPDINIVSSVVKSLNKEQAIKELYNPLYSKVVLDVAYIRDFDFISQFPDNIRDKIVLMPNSECVPNCPMRTAHYDFLSNRQRKLWEHDEPPHEHTFTCPRFDKNTTYNYEKLDIDTIYKKYVPNGLFNFKLVGRDTRLSSLVKTYADYFAKPEYKSTIVDALMAYLLTLEEEISK